MAVRQYIGARYVPKFDGEWNRNKAYEPLTVTESGNASYISKKNVPAGIDIFNTEYWAVYSTQSGAIVDLQTRVLNLENKTEDIEKDLERKTQILIFGDSWVDVHTDPNNIIPNYMARRFRGQAKSYGYGGTGFDVPHGYNDQIDLCAVDSSIDLDNIKMVVLFAGLNEYNAGTTAANFRNKLDAWTNNVRTKLSLPDTPIYWVLTYSLVHNLTTPNHTDFYTQWEYYITVATNLYSDVIPIISFGFAPGDNVHFDSSWYHLTTNGQRCFINNVIDAINGVPIQRYYYYKDRGSLTVDGYTDNVDFVYYLHDDKLRVRFSPAISVIASSSVSANYDLTRNAPAKIPLNKYIGQGAITQYRQPNQFSYTKVKSDEATWLTQSGRYELEFECIPF